MTKSLDNPTAQAKKSFKQHAVAWAIFAGLSMGTVVATDVQAKSPNRTTLRADAPNVYVVKKGDTLWAIAGRFLKKPYQWRTIWAANRQIRNPHLIYPGDRILLCTVDGRPLIGRDEGDGCEGIIRRATGKQPATSSRIRVESLANAIPLIPLENIKNWLEKGIIVEADAGANLPYVVGMPEKHVIAARGDKVYLRGNGIELGKSYGIYRKGDPYTVTGEKGKQLVIAHEYTQVATGAINAESSNGIYTFEILSNEKEVRVGDVIMPVYDAYLPTIFHPIPAQGVVDGGQVIRVLDGVGVAGANNVVTINRGTNHGVDLGHLFAIQQQGALTTDPVTKEQIRLPDENIGHALVFKTFDNMSYAYVTDSSQAIRLGARLATPLE